MGITPAISRWKQHVLMGIACALIVWMYCWSAETGFFHTNGSKAEDDYYNLLVQGFSSGQLSVKRDAPPELAKLSNPYDPSANATSVWSVQHFCYEMSYYEGRLYLYFGVTPALVLFWPSEALTGQYCSHKDAVVIFDAVGFLVAAWLLFAVWRRYFADTTIWNVAVGAIALGLAPCFMDQLSYCDLHEVPRSCGFAFTMLALAAVWNALHQPVRRILWLVLGSVAYALAVGARPTLLPGIVIVLMPVALNWRSSTESASVWKKICMVAAAIMPAMLVGAGLATYNFLRFGDPLEFGWRYQLTDIENTQAHPFDWHYLWFNFKFYFLQPLHWSDTFPFIHAGTWPSLPAHYYGVGNPYCGILVNYPLVWVSLAVTLLWAKPITETLALRGFIWATTLLFVTGAVTLCGFFCGSSSYLSDFMPALMMLAVIGACSLESALKGKGRRLLWFRICWFLLLAYSLTVSVFSGFKTHAYSNYIVANSLCHEGRDAEAIGRFEKSIALDPTPAFFHTGLGNAYTKTGKLDNALEEYQKALERDPSSVEALYDMSMGLIQTGRVNEAAPYFQKVMELNSGFLMTQNPGVQNNIAWLLATSPDLAKRNGNIAVPLAEAACRQTEFKTTVMVGTLAAAYAEAGRFDEAISTAQKACALASDAHDEDLLKNNQKLLSLYRKHEAYRESPESDGKTE